jgi:hypothetical protein
MNATEAIEQIKKALGFSVETPVNEEVSNEVLEETQVESNETEVVETTFAEVEGVEGQLFVVEGDFEIGKEVQIKLEDSSLMPVPNGEYELQNGYTMGVEEGKIISWEEVEEPTEETTEPVEAEPAAEETKKEEKMSDELVEIITRVVKEVHTQMKEEMSAVKNELDTVKNDFEEFKSKPAGKKITSNNFQQKFNNEDDRIERIIKLGKSLNK